MRPVSQAVLFIALAGCFGNAAAAESADRFSGRYGHDASEPAYEPVWEVRRAGEGWQAGAVEAGEFADAYRISPAGRRAFWEKMNWPAATSADADCLSWGDAPPDLMDLLEDKPPAARADTFGNALICHVPVASRQAIDWLAGHAEDWFYYDPMAGVMDVRQLR